LLYLVYVLIFDKMSLNLVLNLISCDDAKDGEEGRGWRHEEERAQGGTSCHEDDQEADA
jgi:hypothetical protein